MENYYKYHRDGLSNGFGVACRRLGLIIAATGSIILGSSASRFDVLTLIYLSFSILAVLGYSSPHALLSKKTLIGRKKWAGFSHLPEQDKSVQGLVDGLGALADLCLKNVDLAEVPELRDSFRARTLALVGVAKVCNEQLVTARQLEVACRVAEIAVDTNFLDVISENAEAADLARFDEALRGACAEAQPFEGQAMPEECEVEISRKGGEKQYL